MYNHKLNLKFYQHFNPNLINSVTDKKMQEKMFKYLDLITVIKKSQQCDFLKDQLFSSNCQFMLKTLKYPYRNIKEVIENYSYEQKK